MRGPTPYTYQPVKVDQTISLKNHILVQINYAKILKLLESVPIRERNASSCAGLWLILAALEII